MPLPIQFAFVLALLLAHGAAQEPASAPPAATPVATDTVIARVADVDISVLDLQDEIDRLIPLNFYHRKVPPERMAEFRREAFDKIVEKLRVRRDAQDVGLVAEQAELDQEFEGALRDAGPEFLALAGAKKAALRAEVQPALEKRVLIRKNEARIAAKVPTITEAMVREVYDRRLAEDETSFLSPKSARFLHVFVAVDPARIQVDEAKKKERIDAAVAELRQGVDFAAVARKYSEDEFASSGGDLGYQLEGSFRMRSIDDRAFAMKTGETSDVIRALDGYHLLHCADVKPPVRLAFAEVRADLESWLRAEHLRVLRERWLLELATRYPVDVLRSDLVGEAPAKK